MNRFEVFKRWAWSILIVSTLAFAIGGCSGDDGKAGPAGPQGPQGPEGPEGPAAPVPDAVQAAIDSAQVESCATCHGGIGDQHQGFYDLAYNSPNNLRLMFETTDVSSVASGGGFTVSVEFTITDRGLPFSDAFLPDSDLRSLGELRFYTVEHFAATDEYLNSCSLRNFAVVDLANGVYSAFSRDGDCAFAPENSNAQVYGYIARGEVSEHSTNPGSEFQGQHVHLYEDVSNHAVAFGTAVAGAAGSYASAANPEGCENCHGTPYLKHGYRAAEVDGIPNFAACKSCHYDDRTGNYQDWQYMVDQPFNWATAALPDADVATQYAYKAKLMNVVHMAHAMEFPYPQSMSNCNTCHENNLAQVLDNSNFQFETCKSCHAVQGVDAWPKTFNPDGTEILDSQGRSVPGKYYQGHRAPPFAYLWYIHDVTFHETLAPDADCTACHGAGIAPAFNELHSGYDHHIYDDAGNRYADIYTASIDSITRSGDQLTIQYSASDPAVAPFLAVSFYGWDTKQFIVPSHTRDATENCGGRGCRFEYRPGDTNPLFSETANSVAGAWEVVVDMAAWVGGPPDSVPNLIADGKIRKLEVSVLPSITLDGEGLGLNAVTETFDLEADAIIDNWFKGTNAVVNLDGCNACHDKLGQTFHGSFGVGGEGTDNMLPCRNCHAPTYDGGHIEMASRSIENYVHAIHSFQDFDPDDTFDTYDPVKALRYELHVNHTFPNFTIRNCEACHMPGTYDVPDQSQALPGQLSASYPVNTWYTMVDRYNTVCGGSRPCIPREIPEQAAARNIGDVPAHVTGPASRACGGCHRADLINDDAAGDLAAFNAHTAAFGTYVEADPDTADGETILFGIIDKILTWLE